MAVVVFARAVIMLRRHDTLHSGSLNRMDMAKVDELPESRDSTPLILGP